MQAPEWAKTTRADEVAETWDGVYSVPGLYEALWVLPQNEIPNIEDSGPHDHIGHDNLAQYWDKLSLDHQQILVDLELQQIWNQ